MLLVGLMLLVLSWPASALAVCTNTGSGTWLTNVATLGTCITNAARNDTITVSDSGTIAVSGFTLTKGVTIVGPGRDVLTLQRSGTVFTLSPDPTTITNSHNIKITGFTIDLNGSSSNGIQINGASATNTKPYRYAIIGGMRIRNGGTLSEGIHTFCQVRGVAYDIIFNNINRSMGPRGCDDLNEWFNPAYNQLAYGTQDTFVLEDWYYLCSSDFNAETPGWFESGQGGRMTVRYGGWDLTNCRADGPGWSDEGFDVHGFQNFHNDNGGQTGTFIAERYGTICTTCGLWDRDIFHRASWGLFFNNIKVGSGSGLTSDQIGQYDNTDNGGSGCAVNIVPSPIGFFVPEVNNTYHFNTMAGTTLGGVTSRNMTNNPIGGGDTCGVSENDANNNGKGWWNENVACTASNCQVGIGKGTVAPTGACKVGVGYWVASDPSAMTGSTTTTTVDGRIFTVYTSAAKTIMQAGTFYKCTGTIGQQGTWSIFAQPLAYPHPLRSAVDTTAPATPTGLSVQ